MRYRRLAVTGLWLDGVRLPLRSGHLLVVDRDGQDSLDWELVLSSADVVRPPQSAYSIEVETDEGHLLRGTAFLVRTDGTSHVLRGTGVLDGFALVGFAAER